MERSAGPWADLKCSEIQQQAHSACPSSSTSRIASDWRTFLSAIRSGFMGLWRTRCAFNCAVTATSTSANRVCK